MSKLTNRKLGALVQRKLEGNSLLRTPPPLNGNEHSYYILPLTLEETRKKCIRKNKLKPSSIDGHFLKGTNVTNYQYLIQKDDRKIFSSH